MPDDHASMFAPLTPEETTASASAAPGKTTKTPITPVPADAPVMEFRHPKHGEPSRSWPYHDAEGRLVGYACRWDLTDDAGERTKEFLPVTFCDLGNGKRGWRSKGMPSPRPLFGLPDLLARSDALVLVCEGEKARDAGAALFPDMVATTPAHGAKSPHLTDFGSCVGRVVVIATDHDEPGKTDAKGKPHHPGRDFGDKVAEMARAVGAVEVLHLYPDRLGAWLWRDGERVPRTDPLPDGWDLADALAEGWTAETVAALRSDPAFLSPYGTTKPNTPAATDAEGKEWDWPFRLMPYGVEKRIDRVDRETGAVTIEWRWICSRIEVAAETRNTDGTAWGRLLTLTDRDGRAKEWAMPMSLLAGDGTAFRAVEDCIRDLCDRFNVVSVGIDPHLARSTLNTLTEDGYPAVEVRQGWITMAPAIKELERAIVGRQFQHGGHAVLRWCFDNIQVETDRAGNRLFSKGKARERIDGAVACAIAVSLAQHGEAGGSIYDLDLPDEEFFV